MKLEVGAFFNNPADIYSRIRAQFRAVQSYSNSVHKASKQDCYQVHRMKSRHPIENDLFPHPQTHKSLLCTRG